MMKREGDYQKHVVDEDRLLRIPRDTTYAQMAARQSQQQRIRNADALARARSAARHSLLASTAAQLKRYGSGSRRVIPRPASINIPEKPKR
jgi:hypothetical protein